MDKENKNNISSRINREQAFNNMVTNILKDCEKYSFTLGELEKIPAIIKEFYYDNASPL